MISLIEINQNLNANMDFRTKNKKTWELRTIYKGKRGESKFWAKKVIINNVTNFLHISKFMYIIYNLFFNIQVIKFSHLNIAKFNPIEEKEYFSQLAQFESFKRI